MGRSSPTSSSTCGSLTTTTTTHAHTTGIIVIVAMLFCLLLPSPVTFLSDHYAYSPSTLLKSLLDPTFKYEPPRSSSSSSSSFTPPQQQRQSSNHERSIYPRCNHMILVTAARHGSTWMIDNIEQCTFSLLRNGTDFGRCNLFSELWMPSHKGPLLNISVDHVLDYVASLMSIKVFPRVWLTNRASVMNLLARSRSLYPIPVVILRRDLTYAYRSQQRAQKRGKWNSNVKPKQSAIVVDSSSNNNSSSSSSSSSSSLKSSRKSGLEDEIDDDDMEDEDEEEEEDDQFGGGRVVVSDDDENPNALTYFIRDREKYFEEVSSFLINHSIPFDTITYENVRHADIIELPVAKCHVVNCNSSRRR